MQNENLLDVNETVIIIIIALIPHQMAGKKCATYLNMKSELWYFLVVQ